MSLLSRIRIRHRPKTRKILKRSDKHISKLSSDFHFLHIHGYGYGYGDDDQHLLPSPPSSAPHLHHGLHTEHTWLLSLIASAFLFLIMIAFFSLGTTYSLLFTMSLAMVSQVRTRLRIDRNPSISDMANEEEEEEEEEASVSADLGSLRSSEMLMNGNDQRKKLQRLNCLRAAKMFSDNGDGDGDDIYEEEEEGDDDDYDISLSDGDVSSSENGKEACMKKKAKTKKMFFKYLKKKEKGIVCRSTPSSAPSTPAFMASAVSEPVSILLRSRAKNPNPPLKLGFQASTRPHHRQQAKVRSSSLRRSESEEKVRSRRLWIRVRVWWMGLCVAMAGLLFGNRIIAIAALSCFWYSTKLIASQ